MNSDKEIVMYQSNENVPKKSQMTEYSRYMFMKLDWMKDWWLRRTLSPWSISCLAGSPAPPNPVCPLAGPVWAHCTSHPGRLRVRLSGFAPVCSPGTCRLPHSPASSSLLYRVLGLSYIWCSWWLFSFIDPWSFLSPGPYPLLLSFLRHCPIICGPRRQGF